MTVLLESIDFGQGWGGLQAPFLHLPLYEWLNRYITITSILGLVHFIVCFYFVLYH